MSTKRKVAGESLSRRVRARRDESEDLESLASRQSVTESASNPASLRQSKSVEEGNGTIENEENEENEESSSEESETEAPDTAATVSFGALAKVQATLGRSEKPSKNRRKPVAADGWEDVEASERKAGHKDKRDFSRSSKHAPTELSSKKAVSRKREVVPVVKRVVRDPRFEALPSNNVPSTAVDESRVRAAYSFLDKYREDEMKELRIAIKTTKDEDAKEKLKRALMSMESRKRAQDRKDKEAEVIAKHRKEEKELVKQGKQPFYLKKAEQKNRVLLDRFGELKGKQLDRVIERRRKKVEGKEKKNMPFARREA